MTTDEQVAQVGEEWTNSHRMLKMVRQIVTITDNSVNERIILIWLALHPGFHKAGDIAESLGETKRWAEANMRRMVRDKQIGVEVAPDYDAQVFRKTYGILPGSDLSVDVIDGTLNPE